MDEVALTDHEIMADTFGIDPKSIAHLKAPLIVSVIEKTDTDDGGQIWQMRLKSVHDLERISNVPVVDFSLRVTAAERKAAEREQA